MAVCDGYPGVGLRRASPPPPTLLHLILLLLLFAPSPWHQSSRLTPGFHRGGTTQASAPNEYRVGLLLLLAFARMWLTRPLNRGRLGFFFFCFTFPQVPSSPLAVRLRRGAELYVLPICHSCLFSPERALCHPAKTALQETPGNHTTTTKKNLPPQPVMERKNRKTPWKKKKL